jgi:hypothetical protein
MATLDLSETVMGSHHLQRPNRKVRLTSKMRLASNTRGLKRKRSKENVAGALGFGFRRSMNDNRPYTCQVVMPPEVVVPENTQRTPAKGSFFGRVCLSNKRVFRGLRAQDEQVHASPAAPGCDRKKKQARTRVRRALCERQSHWSAMHQAAAKSKFHA